MTSTNDDAPDADGEQVPPRKDMAAIWHHYRGYHRSILASGSAAAVAAVAELGMLAILVTLTSIIGSGERAFTATQFGMTISISTGQLLTLAAILVVVRGGFKQLDTYLSSALGSRYEDEKRAQLMDAFLKASWPMQSAQRSHELQDVINGAVGYGRQGVKAVASATGSLASVAIMLAGAITMSWIATIVAIVVSLVFSLGLQPLVRRSKRLSGRVRIASLDYASALGETVSLAREVRLAGAEDTFTRRLHGLSTQLRHMRTREQVLMGAAPTIFETGTILLVLSGLGALYLLDLGNTTRFIALLLLLLRASQYGRTLQAVYHQMKGTVPYLELVDEREEELRVSAPDPGSKSVTDFSVLELRDVSYQYDDEHDALRAANISISAGEVIGIIGPSGSGKTTLVEMLLGLREPTAGSITIDGVDLGEIGAHSWCRLTGLVSQESQLVEGSLTDNVRFFRDSISDDDINAAVTASGLDRDLRSLPDGLATVIGPRSSGLSGGQRQRLAIARVLAGHPRLLVLDEPTSALDVHAEAVVTDTLERLRGTTTIVVVAHRLSTLRVCDKVIVLRNGNVEAFASRAELERDNAYYSSAIALAQLS
jgi:ATP-binding cassette subfamily B protein